MKMSEVTKLMKKHYPNDAWDISVEVNNFLGGEVGIYWSLYVADTLSEHFSTWKELYTYVKNLDEEEKSLEQPIKLFEEK